jgi:DHA3 family macrolide efflux protein-like MFS transporter
MTKSLRGQPSRLFNFNFTLLWQGQAVSQLGDQVFYIAMVLWIKQATGSAGILGLLLMVSSIPGVILGPIGGTFADRHSRKKIIIFTDTMRGLLVVGLAAAVYLLPGETNVILGCLFAVSLVGGVNSAFFAPAITAAIPDLVPKARLAGANAVIQASLQVMRFVGQALGGVLFQAVGAVVLFVFNGMTFLFSALSESFIWIPQKLPVRGRQDKRSADLAVVRVEGGGFPLAVPVSARSESVERFRPFFMAALEGLRYIWRRPGMRELVLGAALLGFFSVPVILLLPFFVEDALGAGAEWYGYLMAVFGIGTLVGSILAGAVRVSGKGRRNMLAIFLIVDSVAFVILGLVQGIGSAVAVSALAGAAGGFVTINVATIVQATTPSEMRGRATSLMATLSGSLTPVAMGLSGVIADLTGQNIRAIYVSCGAIMILLSVTLIANRSLRELIAFGDETEVPA